MTELKIKNKCLKQNYESDIKLSYLKKKTLYCILLLYIVSIFTCCALRELAHRDNISQQNYISTRRQRRGSQLVTYNSIKSANIFVYLVPTPLSVEEIGEY